jgi:glucose-6-phosphate isomerase
MGVAIMKNKLELDLSYLSSFLSRDDMERMIPSLNSAQNMLYKGTGLGSEFLGWLELPQNYDREEYERVKEASEKIRKSCDAFVVVGIGGSYLGARAAIEMLSNNFRNLLEKKDRKGPMIFFAGNNMSAAYIMELLDVVKDMDICVNVISKSGTTTESAIAFRLIKELMEKKYGKRGAAERIFATTDKTKGALKQMAYAEGYECFTIADDVGGRYSVLTSVGLLPMAVAGIDVDEVMSGAIDAFRDLKNENLWENPALQYACVRNALYKKGKTVEILANFEPALSSFNEWWKQLFGESEGKDGKGIFPASTNFTTDLHSMGQYIQDGRRELFETIINVDSVSKDLTIKSSDENLDGLNYLEGKTLNFVNQQAMRGTVLAHNEGGVPVVLINIPELSPYHFGYMVYFFELSCGLSAYHLGVNPFNQPGVEAYKKNMFALLGKSGYEIKDNN